MADVAVSERTLPHNLEAEKSVLGAILIHNDAFNAAAEVIDAGDFFRDAHRRIFDRMVAMNERSGAIDFVTLKEELSRVGELEEVGDRPILPLSPMAFRDRPTSSTTRASSKRSPRFGA